LLEDTGLQSRPTTDGPTETPTTDAHVCANCGPRAGCLYLLNRSGSWYTAVWPGACRPRIGSYTPGGLPLRRRVGEGIFVCNAGRTYLRLGASFHGGTAVSPHAARASSLPAWLLSCPWRVGAGRQSGSHAVQGRGTGHALGSWCRSPRTAAPPRRRMSVPACCRLAAFLSVSEWAWGNRISSPLWQSEHKACAPHGLYRVGATPSRSGGRHRHHP
jgi:hypothetical protein